MVVSKTYIKLKILLKQNWIPILLVYSWFIGNFVYFYIITNNFFDSIFILFYFKSHNSLWGLAYGTWSEFVIFSLLISLITIELFRKYNPAITSREISKKTSNHVVIIGYSHIGARIAEYLKTRKMKYVIVEEDRELIDDLITNEEAIVNDTPLSKQTLEDAGIRKAKAVFITSGDFEVQMVVNYNVRKLNQHCKLVSRVFQDDIAEIISKTYNSEIISTSRYSSEIIFDIIRKNNYKNILVIGLNHISNRLIKKFQDKSHINYNLIEEDEEVIEDLNVEGANIIQGDPREISMLYKADIENIDCVVNVNPDVKSSILITKRVRDLNRTCKIISRIFLDSVAKILEKPPFRSEVISSSSKTLEIMIEKGMFEF